MSDLFTTSALAVLVVSFGIGIVVGLTGMGGGALMTPALIFLGINPTAAIANDLVSAAVTRSVGAAVHWRVGKPNLRLAGLLVCSSVPTAFAGAFLDKLFGDPAQQQHLLKLALGAALLLTATTFVLRVYVQLRYVGGDNTAPAGDPPVKPIPTLLVGAAGGLLVGVTSVGTGSLIMVALLLLYPTLSAGLTFSKEDRETNIRRIGWVAAEISRHGGVAICSPIAPFDATRKQVRAMVDEAGGAFVLVHVATPLEECERRDRKGLYAKARRGEIPEFTGISSPYEEPRDASIRVDTTGRTIEDALSDVLDGLRSAGHLSAGETIA